MSIKEAGIALLLDRALRRFIACPDNVEAELLRKQLFGSEVYEELKIAIEVKTALQPEVSPSITWHLSRQKTLPARAAAARTCPAIRLIDFFHRLFQRKQLQLILAAVFLGVLTLAGGLIVNLPDRSRASNSPGTIAYPWKLLAESVRIRFQTSPLTMSQALADYADRRAIELMYCGADVRRYQRTFLAYTDALLAWQHELQQLSAGIHQPGAQISLPQALTLQARFDEHRVKYDFYYFQVLLLTPARTDRTAGMLGERFCTTIDYAHDLLTVQNDKLHSLDVARLQTTESAGQATLQHGMYMTQSAAINAAINQPSSTLEMAGARSTQSAAPEDPDGTLTPAALFTATPLPAFLTPTSADSPEPYGTDIVMQPTATCAGASCEPESPAGEPLPGDMNGDDLITSADLPLLSACVSPQPFDPDSVCARGDLVINGFIDDYDVQALVLFLSGDITYIPLHPADLPGGDVDLNGSVDGLDQSLLQVHLNMNIVLEDAQLYQADVSWNGQVDDDDLAALTDYLEGWIVQLPIVPGESGSSAPEE